jgi:hypothetical protein
MSRVTIPATVALVLSLPLAGCDRAPTSSQADVRTAPSVKPPLAPEDAAPTPSLPPARIAGELPGPTDRDPTHALAYWRAAMEARDWTAARAVFGEFGGQSGLSEKAFAAAWSKYRIVDVTVGQGEQDAGAGSAFYEVPVTITGLTTDNKPYHLAGSLSLRRVNDVDGATPEQLRWHIERSTLRP